MHAAEAREKGETEQRIYLLSAWREAPCYTDRERAALGWTEALTRLSEGHELRRRPRSPEGAVHRGGAGQAHLDDQHHQRLEPHRGRLRPVCRSGGSKVRRGQRRPRDGGRPGSRRTQRRVSIRCVPSSCASLTACSAPWPTPRICVQEAFIRWMGADRSEVREPEAFLRRTVTRLCLDQLKSARRQRETYIGPWLPDPVVEEEAEEDVTLPLMLALERLSPLERAAFLLHDVFGLGIRGSRRHDRPRCRRLPPARGPRAHPCPRGETALPGGQATRPGACAKPSSPRRATAT